METTELKGLVRARYGGIAAGPLSDGSAPPSSCCGNAADPVVDARARAMSGAAPRQPFNMLFLCTGNPARRILATGRLRPDLQQGRAR